jgi:hypothetical protein
MLKNAIDMHMHTAPDGPPRSVRDLEAGRKAAVARMRAIMLKSHLMPTYGRAAVVQDAVPGILVFGGLVLNVQVGGINPAAVEAACAIGAKCVWMPTISSPQHLRYFNLSAPSAAAFDAEGQPAPGLRDVLELVAKADVILATGHLSPEESLKLLPLARKAGVKKFVVTHPEFEAVDMPVDMQQEFARQGAFIERGFFAANSAQLLPVEEVAAQNKTVGWQSTVLCSDFGQDYNLPPVKGLELFLQELARCGIAERQIRNMVADHPAALLGL